MIAENGQVWDLQKLRVVFRIPTDAPLPDGWTLADLQKKYEIPVAIPNSIAVSASGNRVSVAEPLSVWNVDSRTQTFVGEATGKAFEQIIFSADDSQAIARFHGKDFLQVWDVAKGTLADRLTLGQTSKGRLALTDDSSVLLVGSQKWNIKTRKKLETRLDSMPSVESKHGTVVLAPNNKVAATCDVNGIVRFWDVESGKCFREHRIANCGIDDVASSYTFSNDSNSFVISTNSYASQEFAIHLVEPFSNSLPKRLFSSRQVSGWWPGMPVLSADNQWLFTNREKPGVEIWHVPSGLRYSEVIGSSFSQRLTMFATSPSANVIALADNKTRSLDSSPQSIFFFERESGEFIGSRSGHRDHIRSLAFSHNGKYLVSGSNDRTGIIWSFELQGKSFDGPDSAASRILEGDAAIAYPLMWSLATDGVRAVRIANSYIKPDRDLSPDAIQLLLRELGEPQYRRRVEASKRLREMGSFAFHAIADKIKKTRDLETRRRLQEIIEQPPAPARSLLRDLRLIQVLEYLDTSDSRQVLKRISHESPFGPRHDAATLALDRLKKRRPN